MTEDSWWNKNTAEAQTTAFWAVVDTNNDRLLELVRTWHPGMAVNQSDQPKLTVTAATAEYARKAVAVEIAAKTPYGEADVCWEVARKARNVLALVKIANETWWGIPESIAAHSLDGFGLLCDICSDAPIEMEEESNR